MVKDLIKEFLGFLKCKRHNIMCTGKCYIGGKCINNGIFIIGNKVTIRPSTDIYIHKNTSSLKIGSNTEIGNHSTISAYNEIQIGDGVLTGPHVFIADHNHNYENPNKPIYTQGVKIKINAKVKIGSGTWIGTNAVIVGNVEIGRNCVIGANSVVTKEYSKLQCGSRFTSKSYKKI